MRGEWERWLGRGAQLDGVIKNSSISLFTVSDREITGHMALILSNIMVHYRVHCLQSAAPSGCTDRGFSLGTTLSKLSHIHVFIPLCSCYGVSLRYVSGIDGNAEVKWPTPGLSSSRA